MIKTYQTKQSIVEAIKIQGWTDEHSIKSKWQDAKVQRIADRGSQTQSTLTVDVQIGRWGATVNVDNYLIRHEDGELEVMDEATFREKYELRAKDELLVGLAYAVVKNFGFTFNDALSMLVDDKTRAILISTLEKK